jgi:hypothetical protein
MTFAELLPAAQQLTASDKLKLIQTLSEDLELPDPIAPLEPGKTYDLPTPYDCFGAGAILMEAFKKTDTAQL